MIGRSVSLVLVAAVSVAGEVAADELDGARQCLQITDDVQRLACYDAALGRQASIQPKPAEQANELPTEPSAEAATEPTLDDLGRETVRKEQRRDDIEVKATVVRCERDSSRKKYHFYFDGGQVWRQVSDKRLFFKECSFDVTISRDMFGYKMQIDGERSKIRISRLR